VGAGLRSVRALLDRYGTLIWNVAARIAALASLALATVVVARTGGPPEVGFYALLRVLPALVGVMLCAGLPGAIPYFLAPPRCSDRRLPLTIVSIAVAGGVAGAAIWIAASPLLGRLLFPEVPLSLVILAGATVFTQVCVVTAKACSQGSGDMPGANRVIFTEQFMFLPGYGLLWVAGIHGYTAVVAGLIVCDAATSTLAWARLIRRRLFQNAARPSLRLGRAIAAYGLRAQAGGLVSLLNLRLDFILIGVLASPAVLGVYAVASKFAELIKVPTMAFTYILYPRFARERLASAVATARRLALRAGLLTAALVVPLWFGTFLIPLLYGSSFKPAVAPAQIILLGLTLDGAAAVITGFLYGVGRPGLNSCAMGVGLVATVVLDVLLIPRFDAIGGAVASAVAYVSSALALMLLFWWVARSSRDPKYRDAALEGKFARADSR
jgi:O-antigen/teichoic acid export membrane protein